MNRKIFLPILMLLYISYAYSLTISCIVRNSGSCNPGEVKLLGMSSTTNAHAELPTQTNYQYSVCCTSTDGSIGNSCSGTYAVFLLLSSVTNAHVSRADSGTYSYQACISSTPTNPLSCSYGSSCPAGTALNISISSDTNAHVGNYDAYSIKICCSAQCVRANPTVTISPSSQSGTAGQTLTYTVSVVNNDNAACGASTFTLSASCPQGWSCILAPTSLTISPGSSSSTTINVTSPSTAPPGTYTFSVTATNSNNPSYSGTGSANYVVVQPTYNLYVDVKIDVLDQPLDGVTVTVDSTSQTTGPSGVVIFPLPAGSHTISVPATLTNGRPFSHFWDHDANLDCVQTDLYNTAANPYTFTMAACARNITAFYKVFTHFKNSAGVTGAIEYNYTTSTISGYLLREDGNPLHYPTGATVSLEYFNGSAWNSIGTATTNPSTGLFSYTWSCIPSATALRATFVDPNWYYVGSTGSVNINCITACTYALSITPTTSTQFTPSYNFPISATDSSSSTCSSPITYTVAYSHTGDCTSVSVTPSFSINVGSSLSPALWVNMSRGSSACTVNVNVTAPDGNLVALGTYTLSPITVSDVYITSINPPLKIVRANETFFLNLTLLNGGGDIGNLDVLGVRDLRNIVEVLSYSPDPLQNFASQTYRNLTIGVKAGKLTLSTTLLPSINATRDGTLVTISPIYPIFNLSISKAEIPIGSTERINITLSPYIFDGSGNTQSIGFNQLTNVKISFYKFEEQLNKLNLIYERYLNQPLFQFTLEDIGIKGITNPAACGYYVAVVTGEYVNRAGFPGSDSVGFLVSGCLYLP